MTPPKKRIIKPESSKGTLRVINDTPMDNKDMGTQTKIKTRTMVMAVVAIAILGGIIGLGYALAPSRLVKDWENINSATVAAFAPNDITDARESYVGPTNYNHLAQAMYFIKSDKGTVARASGLLDKFIPPAEAVSFENLGGNTNSSIASSTLGAINDQGKFVDMDYDAKARTTPLMATFNPASLNYPMPNMVVTVKSDKGILDLCIPQLPEGEKPPLYFASDGTAYEDFELTIQSTAQKCPSIVSKVFSPIDISGATSSENPPSAFPTLSITFAKAEGSPPLGTYTNAGFTDGAVDAFGGGKPPLKLVIGAPDYQQPAFTMTITSNLGTLKVCAPQTKGVSLYVGKNGSTYYDAHLTQLARSCQ